MRCIVQMLTDEGMGAAGGVGESLLEELGHAVHAPEIDGEATSAPLLHGAGAVSAEEVLHHGMDDWSLSMRCSCCWT
jgi:hypothetical protein